MTARAPTRVSCEHEADVRDCGPCVAAAHEQAVEAARTARFPESETMPVIAALDGARSARAGHAILREHGIALWTDDDIQGWFRCSACHLGMRARGRCTNPTCHGRRVRCQLPEVR